MSRKTRCILILGVCVLNAAFTVQAGIIQRLDSGHAMKITAIGTSLTTGTTGWFSQTGVWLQGRYPGKVTLSNRAVGASASAYNPPGYPTTGPKDGVHQLSDVLTYDNPDAIFIEFAINDAYTVYGLTLAQSQTNLQTMINTIRDWGASHGKIVDIVVQSMNDCYVSRPDLPTYYQGYKNVAAANTSPYMLFIDNYPHWKNLHDTSLAQWQAYIPDNVHPTSTAATNVILPEVRSSLLDQLVPGDATGDGKVDEADAAALAGHWRRSGGWEDGDFNNDGVIGPADASLLAANWGHDRAAREATAVPEPSAVVLLGMGSAGLVVWRGVLNSSSRFRAIRSCVALLGRTPRTAQLTRRCDGGVRPSPQAPRRAGTLRRHFLGNVAVDSSATDGFHVEFGRNRGEEAA